MGMVPARCLHMQSSEHAALPPLPTQQPQHTPHTALHRAHCPHGAAGTARGTSAAPALRQRCPEGYPERTSGPSTGTRSQRQHLAANTVLEQTMLEVPLAAADWAVSVPAVP